MRQCRILAQLTIVLLMLQYLFLLAARAAFPQLDEPIQVSVDVVPVDVLVTDSDGEPVSGLTMADFEILEDGLVQPIIHFSTWRSAPSPKGSPESEACPSSGDTQPPQKERTFLILLGNVRGNLGNPMHTVAEFLEREMSPGDRVALMAYGKVSVFTTDVSAIARMVRRFPEINLSVQSSLFHYENLPLFSNGLGDQLPPAAQQRADRLFQFSSLRFRQVIPPYYLGERSPARLDEVTEATDRGNNERMREVMESVGTSEDLIYLPQEPEFDRVRRLANTDLPPAAYASARGSTLRNLRELYAAIEYLRYLQGEKHLLYFTSDGLFSGNFNPEEINRQVGYLASDARVRLFIYQLDTVSVPPESMAVLTGDITGASIRTSTSGMSRRLFGGTLDEGLALTTLTKVAETAGGRAFIHRALKNSLTQTAPLLRSGYLLAYRRQGSASYGRFRSIQVQLARADLKVAHRRGYYETQLVPESERERILAYTRTWSAAFERVDSDEILFDFSLTGRGGNGIVLPAEVDLSVALAPDQFSLESDRFSGSLSVAFIFVAKKRSRSLPFWDRIDLKLVEQDYRVLLEQGLRLKRRFELPREFQRGHLLVVVYDLKNDLLGRLEKPVSLY